MKTNQQYQQPNHQHPDTDPIDPIILGAIITTIIILYTAAFH